MGFHRNTKCEMWNIKCEKIHIHTPHSSDLTLPKIILEISTGASRTLVLKTKISIM